jgi:hypothetical protein
MTENDSLQLFLRLIRQKHQLLIARAGFLLQALAGEDLNAKREAAKAMLQAGSDLRAMLADGDVPPWLVSVTNQLHPFIDGRWNPFDLLSSFIPLKSELEGHHWVFDENAETPFDFDSIFNHFKRESRLPELFDEIVRLLEDIHGSGAVDSVTMLRALAKVIATIKRSKDGSYFSFNSAWEFLLSFLNNYLWAELAKLPVLGTALEALGKTIREANEEMFKLHTEVRGEMTRVVEGEIKVLANKSSFPFVTYDKVGHLLEEPNRLISGAKA